MERKKFWNSLLQIEIPISVTLASKLIPSEQVLKLVPGVMIHFEKPYDAPLNLEVDDQIIATGDVVKVGDKFGLKIVAIEQRDERWVCLVDSEAAKPAKSPASASETPAAAR